MSFLVNTHLAQPANTPSEQTSSDASPTEEDLANQPTLPSKPEDPTRYGDWTKGGRCIDF
jgi:hypothetical protein